MPDGFSVFIGAMSVAIAAAVIFFTVSMTTVFVKTSAVSDGYIRQDGKIYSVKPATALRAE